VSEGFREYVREQIERVAPLSMRAMFGGLGLYSNGVFFGLVDDDIVFFKVDDRNRPDFEAAGMQPFRPFGDERASMQYYELPAEVLEDREELRRWIRGALQAALAKKSKAKVVKPPSRDLARRRSKDRLDGRKQKKSRRTKPAKRKISGR